MGPGPAFASTPGAQGDLDFEFGVGDNEAAGGEQQIAVEEKRAPGDKSPGRGLGKKGVGQASHKGGQPAGHHADSHGHVAGFAAKDDFMLGGRQLCCAGQGRFCCVCHCSVPSGTHRVGYRSPEKQAFPKTELRQFAWAILLSIAGKARYSQISGDQGDNLLSPLVEN